MCDRWGGQQLHQQSADFAAHSHVWRDSSVCVSPLLHMCDMTHSYASRDSFVFIIWLIHIHHMTHSYVGFDSCMCGRRRRQHSTLWYGFTCISHVYAWQDSSVCVTSLSHSCDMTHSYVWRDSFVCVAWLVRTRDTTLSCVRHDACVRVTWLNCRRALFHVCDKQAAQAAQHSADMARGKASDVHDFDGDAVEERIGFTFVCIYLYVDM